MSDSPFALEVEQMGGGEPSPSSAPSSDATPESQFARDVRGLGSPSNPLTRELDDDGTLDEMSREFDRQRRRDAHDALARSQAGLLRQAFDGFTDPQQYREILRGVVPGIVSTTGTGLQGIDVQSATALRNAERHFRSQFDIFDRIDRGEVVRGADDVFGYGASDDAAVRASIRARVQADVDQLRAFNQTSIANRPLYQTGEAVTQYAQRGLPGVPETFGMRSDIFVPAPGYERSVGAQVGQGFGSLIFGLPIAAIGGILPAGVVFATLGAGEAAHRAVEWDRQERAAGRPGLTEDQIVTAGLWGVAPGTTDIAPIEVLLGRWKLPLPTAMQRPLAQAIGRIGGQAFIEGAQEGGQQFIQNLIAQQVYNPDQRLMEDVPSNAGVGFLVGGGARVPSEAARAANAISGKSYLVCGGRRLRRSGKS